MSDEEITHVRAHPMPGWLSVIPSKLDGIIRQDVTPEAIAINKLKIEQDIQQRKSSSIFNLSGALLGMSPMAVQMQDIQHLSVTEDEVRAALEQLYAKFESGIIVEIGNLPPGFSIEANDGSMMVAGDKVYYPHGSDLQIGELSFVRMDTIVCWS